MPDATEHVAVPAVSGTATAPSIPEGESLVTSDMAPSLPLESAVPEEVGPDADEVPAAEAVLPGAVSADGIAPMDGTAGVDNQLSGMDTPIIPGELSSPADMATDGGEIQSGTIPEGDSLVASDAPTIPQTGTAPGDLKPAPAVGDTSDGPVPTLAGEGRRSDSTFSDSGAIGEPGGIAPRGTDASIPLSGISGVQDTHATEGLKGSDLIPKAPVDSASGEKPGELGSTTTPVMIPTGGPAVEASSRFAETTLPATGGVKPTAKIGESDAVPTMSQIQMGMGAAAASGAATIPSPQHQIASSENMKPQSAAAIAIGAVGASTVIGAAAMNAVANPQGIPAASAPGITTDPKPISTVSGSDAPFAGQHTTAPVAGTQIPGVAPNKDTTPASGSGSVSDSSGTYQAPGISPMPGVTGAVPSDSVQPHAATHSAAQQIPEVPAGVPVSSAAPAGETPIHTDVSNGDASGHPGTASAVPGYGTDGGQHGVIPSEVKPAAGSKPVIADQTQLGSDIHPAAEMPTDSVAPIPPGTVTAPATSSVPVSDAGSHVITAPAVPHTGKAGEPGATETAPAISAAPAEAQPMLVALVPGAVPEMPAPAAGAITGMDSAVPVIGSTLHPNPAIGSTTEIPHGDGHDASSGIGGTDTLQAIPMAEVIVNPVSTRTIILHPIISTGADLHMEMQRITELWLRLYSRMHGKVL